MDSHLSRLDLFEWVALVHWISVGLHVEGSICSMKQVLEALGKIFKCLIKLQSHMLMNVRIMFISDQGCSSWSCNCNWSWRTCIWSVSNNSETRKMDLSFLRFWEVGSWSTSRHPNMYICVYYVIYINESCKLPGVSMSISDESHDSQMHKWWLLPNVNCKISLSFNIQMMISVLLTALGRTSILPLSE